MIYTFGRIGPDFSASSRIFFFFKEIQFLSPVSNEHFQGVHEVSQGEIDYSSLAAKR